MADDLQVENGNFTRIVNPLIEHLIQLPFKGCELAVAIFIIRKTYGFQKKQDEISLTQFQQGLKRSRQTIVTALKNLQLVNVARLVKRGSMKGDGNIWTINKYHDTWELGKMARLVKRKRGASLTEAPNLVKTARHTKETKEKTKESTAQSAEVSAVINLFKEVNPSYQRLFGMPPQRAAVERMLKTHGVEKLTSMVVYLPKSNATKYAPTITTPSQFEAKLGDLIAWAQKEKSIKSKRQVIV